MKKKLHSILLFLAVIALAFPGYARERIALVIGNSNYESSPLANPINDAKDISDKLRKLSFDVIFVANATQRQMETAIRSFGKKLHKDSVGLFYFSGHGVQYDGGNYLIPIGAMSQLSVPEHLRYKAVDAGYVLGVMKTSGSGLNMVFLDACRNNPFQSFSRSMGRGLVRMPGAEGTLIAYSTAPGKVALDGSGRNSPYTHHLLNLMDKPNVPIELVLKRLRAKVKSQTQGKQSPWYEASIDGDFFFSQSPRIIESKKPTNKKPSELEVMEIINKYISVSSNKDINELLKLYGDRVEYFGAGIVSKDFVYDDKRNYYKRWPIVYNDFIRLLEIVSIDDGSKTIVNYLANFDVYSNKRRKGVKGTAKNTIVLENQGGIFKIVSDKQNIINKTKY